jgi:nanoRNase/pAp phosphatase (c-di-AMP/oligoRNAs hydrolase)
MSETQVSSPNLIGDKKLAELRAAAGPGPVLIITHNNPDPDALASGKALATLFESAWGITSRLVYCGLVARAENKAMLHILTPEWEYVDPLPNPNDYSSLALVDTQPGAGNNSLPDDVAPHIVIDHHHPIRQNLGRVPFADVRTDVGATVSLVYQYMEAARIEPDAVLATAMFYGIQTDTRGLSRGDSLIDQNVYLKLLSLIDRQKMIQVEQAGLPREYFQAFSKGLNSARLYGRVVVSYLGSMHRPDFMAEMADLLIRLENVSAVLCQGCHQQVMYLSLRTAPGEKDAGQLIQRIVVSPGKGGGHGMTAGGQVPLNDRDMDRVAAEIQRRFLQVMGEKGEGQPLLGNES